MRILKMNDGTVHEISMCGESNCLWICLTDVGKVKDAAVEFDDPEKTRRMVSTWDTESAPETVFEGFTDLTAVQKDPVSGILVALRQTE